MRKIKTIVKTIITTLIFVLIYSNMDLIVSKVDYVYRKYLQPDLKQDLKDNEYKKNKDYKFVQIRNDYKLKNKNDIINSIYTYIDAGWEEYTLICDVEYLECINDFKLVVDDKNLMSDINNFVHPFNSFYKLNSFISENGKIVLKKENKYSKEFIDKINKKTDEIFNELYDKNKTDEDNIRVFHDFIINNTKYDVANKDANLNNPSSTAYGVLYNNLGICSGYTDTMAIFLDKMNIPNYRISSTTHTWNLVYVNNTWKHLDLTWDDPVTNTGKDEIIHSFFLVDYNKILKDGNSDHLFNMDRYKEAY